VRTYLKTTNPRWHKAVFDRAKRATKRPKVALKETESIHKLLSSATRGQKKKRPSLVETKHLSSPKEQHPHSEARWWQHHAAGTGLS